MGVTTSSHRLVLLLFSRTILLQSVLMATGISQSKGLVVLPENVTVPAIFMFGDSIVDTGNNNNLWTVVRSDFAPYGRDFKGGKATGRFSNGKVPADIMAEEFGVKDTLPAFLDPSLTPEELLTGVNFASSGTGFDPLTSKLFGVISMSQQLQLFSECKEQLNNLVGTSRADEIVADSLYMVVSGTNDLAGLYYYTPFRKLKYDIPSYIDLLVKTTSAFLQELYELGARRIVILGLTPLGCLPAQRTLSGGPSRVCVELLNDIARTFNAQLMSTMEILRTTLPQARFAYVDGYGSLMDIIKAPHKYGFDVADRGCCGTGLLEAGIFCNRWSLGTCKNASRFLFWDSYHPTERAYRILMQKLIRKIVQDIFK